MKQRLLAFDCDGVLRDESVSYQRCIVETVAFFGGGSPATNEELIESMKKSNNDWERTHQILKQRGIKIDFETVRGHFQDLYLGKDRQFSGYINNEPWLVEDNTLLARLSRGYNLAIVSGSPQEEVRYALRRNGAEGYFQYILGMHDCKGKKDGLEKAIARFKPKQVFFCDDRPSPIKQAKSIQIVHPYGILPPQRLDNWAAILKEAGAEEVFQNVREYCNYFLNREFGNI